MKRPLIGITTNPFYPKSGLSYDKLAHTYCRSVQAAGGIPILLPNTLSAADIVQLRSRLDGVLLSGGGDIAAERYNEADSSQCWDVSADRDELEFALVHLSVETDWPLLGICRGTQVVNVALGGTLYTDLPTQFDSRLPHNTPENLGREYIAHEVTIVKETVLAGIISGYKLSVNSFHHQAVKQVAPRLQVNATAADGLVEGLELPGRRFFLGVQWHPECLPRESVQQALFTAFIRSAGSD
jgi:putative glutamine amidotransferase